MRNFTLYGPCYPTRRHRSPTYPRRHPRAVSRPWAGNGSDYRCRFGGFAPLDEAPGADVVHATFDAELHAIRCVSPPSLDGAAGPKDLYVSLNGQNFARAEHMGATLVFHYTEPQLPTLASPTSGPSDGATRSVSRWPPTRRAPLPPAASLATSAPPPSSSAPKRLAMRLAGRAGSACAGATRLASQRLGRPREVPCRQMASRERQADRRRGAAAHQWGDLVGWLARAAELRRQRLRPAVSPLPSDDAAAHWLWHGRRRLQPELRPPAAWGHRRDGGWPRPACLLSDGGTLPASARRRRVPGAGSALRDESAANGAPPPRQAAQHVWRLGGRVHVGWPLGRIGGVAYVPSGSLIIPEWAPTAQWSVGLGARSGLETDIHEIRQLTLEFGALVDSNVVPLSVSPNSQQFVPVGGGFTYYGAPNITILSPSTGPTAGDPPALMVAGTGLHTYGGVHGGSHYRCRFGGASASDYVYSPATLSAGGASLLPSSPLDEVSLRCPYRPRPRSGIPVAVSLNGQQFHPTPSAYDRIDAAAAAAAALASPVSGPTRGGTMVRLTLPPAARRASRGATTTAAASAPRQPPTTPDRASSRTWREAS